MPWLRRGGSEDPPTYGQRASRRPGLRTQAFPAVRKTRPVGTQRQHERRAEHGGARDDVERVDDELLAAQHRQRAKRDLHRQQDEQQDRGPPQLALLPVVIERVAGRCHDHRGDDQRANPMREMDRDLRVPHRGNQVAKRQREVRNRQPRLGVPHRRADENLDVDQDGRDESDALEESVIGGPSRSALHRCQGAFVRRRLATPATSPARSTR